MSWTLMLRRFSVFLTTLLFLLTAAPAGAAKLIPGKTELLVGETVYVALDADLALFADWSASPELSILDSSGKGATVKGVAPGQGSLTVKYLGGKKTVRLLVKAAAPAAPPSVPESSGQAAPPPSVPPYPTGAGAPAPGATAGGVQFAQETSPGFFARRQVFQSLNELTSRRTIDLATARQFFLDVQAANPGGNVWQTLRDTKRAYSKEEWAAVQRVENQLVAIVRETLVGSRQQVIRNGRLGSVFAFLDSGKWRNRAESDLFFDTDFDTTFFSELLADVDPKADDNVISRVEQRLQDLLGFGSKHLGIELTGYGFESSGDNYVSKTGKKWAMRESASHIHFVDPLGGRISQNVAEYPNALFARLQRAALRQRHPELFDAAGNLLPHITQAEVRRILQNEPGLARQARMVAEGPAMNVADAALGPIDMACHLTETSQSTNRAEEIAKISKQVARSTSVFIEGMGGGEAGQRAFTPAEMEFMRVTRALETAKIDRAAAEAEISRFMQANPDASTWTEAQAAELDRLVERARGHRSNVEQHLKRLESGWGGSFRQTALAVMRKQAKVGFDANLRDILGRPAAERTRALGDFAQEMEFMVRHYEAKGAPAEMTQWARQGLETSLILHEMARDPRFTDLWAQFERLGRAGPREVARLRELLGQSEAGRRLLERVGVALDNIVNPPKELALGHPMADAGRSLREIAGSYTALVGHTALLVGMVDAAYMAKNNDELIENIAHTLVGTTTVGLILQEGQRYFQGDPIAIFRLVHYLIVPETMLPALVEALGHSTINLGAAFAFDTQLDALYLTSEFSDDGQLLAVSGYPRGQLAEMVSDILGPGGYKALEDMVGRHYKDRKEFIVDQAKGLSETMKHAVVSAMRATLINGNHLVFRDDATLGAIAANIRKYRDEIDFMTRGMGLSLMSWGINFAERGMGVEVEAGETANAFYPNAWNPLTLTALDPKATRELNPSRPGWAASLDRGQLRALALLFVTRDYWRNEAHKAFLATLTRTLEERHRAEQDVDAGQRDAKRKQLMELFDALDIRDTGTTAYEQEAGYNLLKHIWNVTLGFATPRERAVHEMKALNRYLDVYPRVADVRFAIEAEIVRRTGRAPVPRPLTGFPALTGVPAIDYPATEDLAKLMGQLGDKLSQTLTDIKKAPLEGDYDSRMFARIYEAQYVDAYWSEAMRSTHAYNRQVAIWKVVAKTDLYALGNDCFNRSSAAGKLAQDLIQEFRDYYANLAVQGELRVSPADLTEGDRFTAEVALTQGVVPKGARWVWEASGNLQLQGTDKAASGVAGGSGRVTAKLVDAAGKTLASLARDLSVKAKPDGDKPGDDGGGDDGGGTGGSTKPTCSFEYSEWGECVRATKTQTRTVTARTPANCEERRKPQTEQRCTPPPTEEDRRNQYFNCLCRCSSGWAGHIGVWYDPEGKTVPECKSNGPCIGGIGAFGCSSRHFFAGPSDCAKGCWEAAWGKGSYDADKADALRKAENKKFKQPLEVKIKASKNPADFGDIVELTAETKEGSGGYRWNWGGCAQDAKDAHAKVLNSRDCKPCDATVTATDQDGDSASDSLTIQCTALRVRLTKESPKEDRIPVGGRAALFAEVFSGDKPAGGSFTYYWEPNPDVQYGTDPKNPVYETSGGSQSRNTAVFRKLGGTPVWVTVLKDVGGRKMTMGESEQIRIEVVSPQLTLKVDKPNPVVGETVTVTVEEQPKMSDDLLSFWWEYKGDANNPGPVPNVPNSRAWSFKPKNDKPVTITVHAKSKDTGDELDSQTVTVTAQKAEVTVSGPRIAGPEPMIWKEGVGLVPAGRQVAEHQRVEFSATVSPATGDLRYAWRVDPSGCTLHSPYSRETGVTCSSTGSYTLTVTVKNADGAELGSGSGNLAVTVSQAQIKQGQQKDAASKQLNQAKQLWNQGKIDEAVAAAESAAQVDPAMAAPTLNQFSQGLKQQGWDALHKGERDTAIRKLEQAARLNPKDPDAQKKLAEARDHVAKWPQVEAKVRAFDDHIANKRIWSAQRTMLEMQDILRTMAAGQSGNNPTWKRVMDDFNNGLQDYNRFTQEKSARHTQYFKEENYPEMLRNAESMRERELSPADEKECQSRIDFAKRYLKAAEFGRQASELTRQGRYEEALRAIEQGREIDYKQVKAAADELSTTLKRLGKEAEQKRDFATSGKYYALALKLNPQDGEAIGGDVNAKQFQKYADQLRAWQREIDAHIQRGDWDKSEDRLKDVDRMEALLPGERYPESLSLHARQKEGYAAYKAWVEPLKQEVGRFLQHSCLDKAEAKIMEMRARHLIWTDQDWTRVFLDSIAESRRTCSSGNVPLKNNCGRDCAVDGGIQTDGTGRPVSANANGASLGLDSDVVEPNAALNLRWTAPGDVPDNTWVGLQPADKPHGRTSLNDQYDMAFKYIGKGRSGSMAFTAPNAVGRYDLRMNNPANDRELVSVTFEVRVASGGATLTLPKAVYAPNEKVTVSFTASPGYPKNTWVGLIPADKPHGKTSVNDQYDLAYRYVEGKTQGSLEFTAPSKEGSYDLRMNETTNDREVASVTFKVAVPLGSAELSLPKAAFKPGEAIRLAFRASGLLPGNSWVGLIPSDKPHGKTALNDQYDVAYRYLEGKTSGTLDFTAPGGEGNWDFRLNETTNDREVISLSFRVDKNAPATGTPIKATNPADAVSGSVGGVGGQDGGGGTVVGGVPINKPPTYTGPGIQVQSGNYGHNCGAPFYNVTDHLAASCNGKARCEYVIDYRVIGDPVPGCAKDYVAVWKCPGDDTWYATDARPEAGFGSKITLECKTGTATGGTVSREELTARTWRFGRGDGSVIAEPIRLTAEGRMAGYYHPNEDNWSLENGLLVFRNPSNQVITRFTERRTEGDRLILSGPFLPNPPGVHVLTEVGRSSGSAEPPPGPPQAPDGAKLVLEDDAGPYKWVEATEVQTRRVHAGRAAFRSTGNNHFTHRLGLAGNYAGQYRYLDLWLYFDKPGADVQIQVQVDGNWGKRWGLEAGPKYDGFGWPMEGKTENLAAGRWLNIRLDLIEQLKVQAGQAITGLAFSSDHGDVYYDAVYLVPSGSPLPPPTGRPTGKPVLEDDAGPYKWIEATQVQKEVVAHGQAAFRSTGNNHFTAELGMVGDYPEQFRTLSFWMFPIGAGADMQLQVQVDGTWGKRWGYEAGPKYDGFGWAMEGTTANLKPGIWQQIRIDLVRDLKIHPGQKVTGLAFSSDHGDVYYDSVYLHPAEPPAVKPTFRPTGKPVLEDDLGSYNWIDKSLLQVDVVFHGNRAFRSTGNNHFTAELGAAGNAAGQFRSIGFWAFFIGPEADLQLQVQVNGSWGKRWGFDAGPKYNGYGWAMEGSTANLPNGRWTWIQVDLLDQLHMKPGERITGLAFSSDHSDVYYDSVYLLPSGSAPGTGSGSTPVAGPAADGGASLTMARSRFAPGENIVVQFTAPTGWASNAWVGIIPSNVAHGSEAENDRHDVSYQYLQKRGSGTLTFASPGVGRWDLRMHDTDGGGREHASVSFEVVADAVPAGRDYTAAPAGREYSAAQAGAAEASFQGHRYRAVLVPGGISWVDAERAARAAGGVLASIGSAAENDAVYALVRDDDRFWVRDSYGNGIGPWLGGLQGPASPEPAGGWRWVSGEPFAYSNWAPGEPNNSNGAEDRLHLFGLQSLKGPAWNDISGIASVRGYVIEFGDATGTPTARGETRPATAPAEAADDTKLDRTLKQVDEAVEGVKKLLDLFKF